jgi:hypothetical protein
MIHRILPGQNRGAGWATGVHNGVVARKRHGIRHERLQVWQLDMVGQGTKQAVGPHLVNQNEENISLFFSFRAHLFAFLIFGSDKREE